MKEAFGGASLIPKFKTHDEAESGLMQMLAARKLVRVSATAVYRDSDPRTALIKEWAPGPANWLRPRRIRGIYAISRAARMRC